jgi:hypothetical protein
MSVRERGLAHSFLNNSKKSQTTMIASTSQELQSAIAKNSNICIMHPNEDLLSTIKLDNLPGQAWLPGSDQGNSRTSRKWFACYKLTREKGFPKDLRIQYDGNPDPGHATIFAPGEVQVTAKKLYNAAYGVHDGMANAGWELHCFIIRARADVNPESYPDRDVYEMLSAVEAYMFHCDPDEFDVLMKALNATEMLTDKSLEGVFIHSDHGPLLLDAVEKSLFFVSPDDFDRLQSLLNQVEVCSNVRLSSVVQDNHQCS